MNLPLLLIATVLPQSFPDTDQETVPVAPPFEGFPTVETVGTFPLTLEPISAGRRPARANSARLIVSPDGTRVANIVKNPGGLTVIADGVASRDYDQVKSPIFSSNSQHLAYAVEIRHKWHVVHDGRIGPPLDAIQWSGRRVGNSPFSQDGSSVAYQGKRGGIEVLVIDSAAGSRVVELGHDRNARPDERITTAEVALTADHGHVIRRVRVQPRNGALINKICIDDRERLVFQSQSIAVASSGSAFGYVYYQREDNVKQYFVVTGDAEQGPFSNAPAIFELSPDGQHHFILVQRPSQDPRRQEYVMVADGVTYGPYRELWLPHRLDPGEQRWEALQFSPDSKHFVFVGARKNHGDAGFYVIYDGKELGPYEAVGKPVFSPDSEHLAFDAVPLDSRGESVLVMDGRPSEPYVEVHDPVFSPDSKRLAFVVQAEGRRNLVIADGKPGPVERAIVTAREPGARRRVVFSPDSRHFAYIADDGTGPVVVVDGTIRFPAVHAEGIQFTPDSRHVVTSDGLGLAVDGHVADLGDRYSLSSPLRFYPSNEQIFGLLMQQGGGLMPDRSENQKVAHRCELRISASPGVNLEGPSVGAVEKKGNEPVGSEGSRFGKRRGPSNDFERLMTERMIAQLEKQLEKEKDPLQRSFMEQLLEQYRKTLEEEDE